MKRPIPQLLHFFLLLFLIIIFLHNSYAQDSDSTYVNQDSVASQIPDTSDYYPGDLSFNLIVASSKGYDAEVLRLLNKGAEINASTTDGVTPLMYAVQNEHFHVVKILMVNGADPDLLPIDGPPALIVAVSKDNMEICEILIRKGADINIQDQYGRTALMHSVAYGYSRLVDMLLYYEAPVNSSDNKGLTALMIAGYYGFTDIAGLLIDKQATLEKQDKNGFTVLHYASQNNHSETIQLLLSKGVDIEIKNKAGYSPLSVAVLNNHKDLTDFYIQNKANVNTEISKAYRVLNVARKNKNDSIISLLEENNAKPSHYPSIDYGSINFDFNFSPNDFLLGGGIGVHDSRYGISMNLGFATRILATEILEGVEDEIYYQYWERRSYMYLGLMERLPVYSWAKDHWFGFGLGAQVLYTWGSYRGSNQQPENRFIFSPQIGVYTRIKYVVISFKYEYINFKVEGLSPNHFVLGLNFLIPGKRIKQPVYKVIVF